MGKKRGLVKQTSAIADLDLSLQDIVDIVEDELLVIDSNYRVRFARLSTAEIPREGVESSPIGSLCYEVFHDRDKPCGTPLWDCPLQGVIESGRAIAVVHPSINLDGANTYLKISAYPVRDARGNPRAIIELRRDVTAERELETQLLKRHHQLLALSHISSAVAGLWDLDAVLRIALDNVLEIVNGDIGGILLLDEEGKTLSYRTHRGLSTRYASEMKMPLGKGIAGQVAQTSEAMLIEDISKDPRAARPDLITAEGIKGLVSIPLKSKEQVVGVMNIASHEIGQFGADAVALLNSIGDYLGSAIEQARLYEQLARVGKRYQILLQHSLTAQEQERKRIARELHDETSQALTSLTLSLQAIIQITEMKGFGDAEFMDKLKKTHANAVHTGNEIVKLMKELRPTLLDELGLPAAIHRYAKDTLQNQGIKVSAKFKGTSQRLPPEIEVTLFRVAQGLIGNILEHSEAKNASIRLECGSGECRLHIDDDGKGFDVSKLTQVDASGRGAGLFTIKERARLVGGWCQIDSQPGQGTRITVHTPMTGDAILEEDKSIDSR
ncbi:GAF domain-containing protein [Chloroflexota bacterium]